jgi:hypothetical protein
MLCSDLGSQNATMKRIQPFYCLAHYLNVHGRNEVWEFVCTW